MTQEVLPTSRPGTRCGIDTITLERFERFLTNQPSNLDGLFTASELEEAGNGAGRLGQLAARFAAKEACCKLFPRETTLGLVQPADFAIARGADGVPCVQPAARVQIVLDLYRIARIKLSLTHAAESASAVAMSEPKALAVPWFGKLFYHLLPFRRRLVLENMHRVFGDVLPAAEIRRLAQAYYAHFVRFLGEFVRLPFMSAQKRKEFIRVENIEAPLQVHAQGKGVLLLTGHFGNWEVATVAGIGQFPQYRNLLHFVRRPLKPRLLNDFVDRRFRRAGFGTLAKRGSLDTIVELLGSGAIIVFVFDQHAGTRDGIAVDFFGHPAGTFKSLALLALTTQAPVIPAFSWREPDGTHVLRFEEPLPLIECENVSEAIRKNTRAYNAAMERMLLRHPEQWIWMHKRWKVPKP